jgi:cytosine/adenosine deaminase-related metal-dependent hydrolase
MAVLHRSPWLLPLSQAPLPDGALLLHQGRILDRGPFHELVRTWPAASIHDHPNAVLLPGLINAHSHLDLSLYAFVSQEAAPPSFPLWIKKLIEVRQQEEADAKALLQAARTVLEAQQAQGVVALADISNSGLNQQLTSAFQGWLLCCKEYLGLRADGLPAALHRLTQEHEGQICTGHAPYSTHPQLLQALKQRARGLGHIFPLHTAESLEEQELFCHGSGALRDFLQERGVWDGSLHVQSQEGVVAYLHRHGLLDTRTLCVHCVHLTRSEMQLLAATGVQVCLCPGSNDFLGVGRADLRCLLQQGILPALGTDSLASNPELSLWREMQLLAQELEDLSPEQIVRMASLGGARALALEEHLGSLDVGKAAAVIAVEMHSVPGKAAAVFEHLVHQNFQAVQRLDLINL